MIIIRSQISQSSPASRLVRLFAADLPQIAAVVEEAPEKLNALAHENRFGRTALGTPQKKNECDSS